MPEARVLITIVLAACLVIDVPTVSSEEKKQEAIIPERWSKPTNPIQLVAVFLKKDRAATDEEIKRDLVELSKWAVSNSEFITKVKEKKTLRYETPDELDDLIAQVWQEIRTGHADVKIGALPMKEEMKNAYLAVTDGLVSVKIHSNPPKAQVFINGIEKKTTNMSTTLTAKAEYKIELKLRGYVDGTYGKFVPEKDKEIVHPFEMKK